MEGMAQLASHHRLFSAAWFQSPSPAAPLGCWQLLLRAALRAVLLRAHSLHADSLAQLLLLLSQADLSHAPAFTAVGGGGVGAEDGKRRMWVVIGGEVGALSQALLPSSASISADVLLQAALQALPDGDTLHMDMQGLERMVLAPLAAEIAMRWEE